MRGAYGRPPVDRRVRERLRTGSDGTSSSGKAGQVRARSGKPQDRWFKYEIARADFACFSTRIGTLPRGKCESGAQKGPRRHARFGAPKLAHCSGHFSPRQYVGALLSKFKLWILQTIGTLVGTFVTNRQKSVKIGEIEENH